jgi:hypothetical protein
MSLSFEEVNIIGNIINDTFGKSSTGYDEDQLDPSLGGFSKFEIGGHRQGSHDTIVVKCSLEGETLCVTAVGIYNLGPHAHQHQVIQTADNELSQFVKKRLTFIKKEFKKKENAGRALKTKELKDKGRELDIQDLNHYAETRPSYIYKRAYFEVS